MNAWWKMRPNQLSLPSAHETSSHTNPTEHAAEPIVHEFRSKLRMAEEMIEKLRFNLREIREAWRKPS